MPQLRIAVITCSDTRSRGEAEDTAGPALVEAAESLGWTLAAYRVVPDDTGTIAEIGRAHV